jgi:MinD superfamily P-loop ATPase
MMIAIASGKGGTGKTTVATSFALALSDSGFKVFFLDCDVEAPNAHIFLQPDLNQKKPVTLPVPQVNDNLCSACGRCAEVCQYNAIVVFGRKTLVFPQLCHGCGSCTLECPEGAITEIPRELGVLEAGSTPTKVEFAHGILNVGEPMAVPIISQLKDWQDFSKGDIVILDSPPGASCPVVASVRGADYVLLVTEPTPFGLHDLKLAVELTRELNTPAGVIINRDGIGNHDVEDYCLQAGIPILLKIPFEMNIGKGIAEGKALTDIHPEYRHLFTDLYNKVTGLAIEDRDKR